MLACLGIIWSAQASIWLFKFYYCIRIFFEYWVKLDKRENTVFRWLQRYSDSYMCMHKPQCTTFLHKFKRIFKLQNIFIVHNFIALSLHRCRLFASFHSVYFQRQWLNLKICNLYYIIICRIFTRHRSKLIWKLVSF